VTLRCIGVRVSENCNPMVLEELYMKRETLVSVSQGQNIKGENKK
jgi:hypothetical protein